MKRMLTCLALLAWLPLYVMAGEARLNTDHPELEGRLVELADKLRCVVCQNESVADSNSELATAMRRELRTQLAQGKTDQEAIDFMVARYGDFVLYEPPFKPVTYLLWFGPALFLMLGGGAWYLTLRRRRAVTDTPLSAQQQAAAKKLLQDS